MIMSKRELLQRLFARLSPEWRHKSEQKLIAAGLNKRVVKSLTTAELLAVQVRLGDLKMMGTLEETLNPPQGDLL